MHAQTASENCENHNLLPDFQSAYQKHYSTETSLIGLTNDILWSVKRQHITSLAILDLSAAFDIMDHDILLQIWNKNLVSVTKS